MSKADDRLIYLISRAQRSLGTYLKMEFQSEKLKITPVQTGILFLLQKRAHTMTELSQQLSIDNSAVTGLVDRLEKAGLARRSVNPDDRRTFLIHITDYGLEEISRAYKIVRRVNEEIKAGFTEEEVAVFKNMLNRFFDKFE